MYARSTTVRGDPQHLDDGMTYVHDTVMPAVQQMGGCIGISMLADRETGRCIVTTSWADLDAMRASAQGVMAMRERAAQVFRGNVDVAEWDIAVLHRMRPTGDGACAAVTWTHGDPADLEHVVDTFRMTMLPKMEETPGFCSVSMMLDRASGRGVTAVTLDNRASMEAALDRMTPMRDQALHAMNREVMENATFDVILAHLRVPETV